MCVRVTEHLWLEQVQHTEACRRPGAGHQTTPGEFCWLCVVGSELCLLHKNELHNIRQVVLMSWLISFSVSVVWRECKPSLYSAGSSVRCVSGYLRKYKLIYLQYSKLDIFSGVCWNERLLFLSFNYLVSRRTGRQQHSALLFSPVLNICC